MAAARRTGVGRRVAILVEQIKPILAGQRPHIQSAALADATAIYLAGHIIIGDPEGTERMRAELFDVFIAAVRELVPVNEKIIHGDLT